MTDLNGFKKWCEQQGLAPRTIQGVISSLKRLEEIYELDMLTVEMFKDECWFQPEMRRPHTIYALHKYREFLKDTEG